MSRSHARITRDGTYNAVSVSGQTSDANVPPVYGFASDGDPASPTYYNGPFGKKPRFYSSQYITTTEQANDVAINMLAEALAINSSLTFNALMVPFLESGDVIAVELDNNRFANHILQHTDMGLSHTGVLSCATFVNKVVDDISDGGGG